MDIELFVQTLLQTIKNLEVKIVTLESELAVYKNKKNQSLREPTDRKVGGQPGHEGTTLKFSSTIDQTIKHSPVQCDSCGNSLASHPEQLVNARQLIDIPSIVVKCIEHQIYKKQCSCGRTTVGTFPKYVANPIQYGPNVESLIGYMHARQYLPYGRAKAFLNDVMGLPISTGGIHHILQRIAQKALPVYQAIKEKITKSSYIGADETGVNINGKNHWAWTWQNNQLTYILCAASRGFGTIQEAFAKGFAQCYIDTRQMALSFSNESQSASGMHGTLT